MNHRHQHHCRHVFFLCIFKYVLLRSLIQASLQKLRKATISCPSTWNNCFQWTDFHEIWYLSVFRKSAQKIKESDNNNGLDNEHWMCMIISSCIILRMGNASDKRCRENQSSLLMFNNPPTPHPQKSRAVYEIVWNIIIQPDRPLVTI